MLWTLNPTAFLNSFSYPGKRWKNKRRKSGRRTSIATSARIAQADRSLGKLTFSVRTAPERGLLCTREQKRRYICGERCVYTQERSSREGRGIGSSSLCKRQRRTDFQKGEPLRRAATWAERSLLLVRSTEKEEISPVKDAREGEESKRLATYVRTGKGDGRRVCWLQNLSGTRFVTDPPFSFLLRVLGKRCSTWTAVNADPREDGLPMKRVVRRRERKEFHFLRRLLRSTRGGGRVLFGSSYLLLYRFICFIYLVNILEKL